MGSRILMESSSARSPPDDGCREATVFDCTLREQGGWPEETVDAKTFVQMAIVHRGNEVSVFRDGHDYVHYNMPNPPQEFGRTAIVLFGRRHIEATDPSIPLPGESRMHAFTTGRWTAKLSLLWFQEKRMTA